MTTPPLPSDITVTTVTARYVHPDGSPAAGSVTFSAPVLTFVADEMFTVGPVEASLDANGQLREELVSTDNPGVQPQGWTYHVVERFAGVEARSYDIFLPHNPSTVDLAQVAPASPLLGTYLPVVGPQGPQGLPTTVNGHSGAVITLTAADVGAAPLPQSWSQAIPSTTWTIPHAFPYQPLVATYDVSGQEIGGVVTYPDPSHVTVVFLYAETGSAVLH